MSDIREALEKATEIQVTKTLLPGYDWLCPCGESNYSDETYCLCCDKPKPEEL